MTKKAEEILDLRKKNPAQSLRRCFERDDDCALCGPRLRRRLRERRRLLFRRHIRRANFLLWGCNDDRKVVRL